MEQPTPEQEYFCFRLGDFQFGVGSAHVLEVLRPGPVTPLPKTPAFLLGVCAHRGDVLPVLDLLRLLGKGEARVGSRSRFFVGVWETFVAALVADSIIGLRRFPLAEILPVPLGDGSALEHLSGVVKPGARGETTLLLNLPMIFQTARQQAVAG